LASAIVVTVYAIIGYVAFSAMRLIKRAFEQ
jgi:hypothetical protein